MWTNDVDDQETGESSAMHKKPGEETTIAVSVYGVNIKDKHHLPPLELLPRR